MQRRFGGDFCPQNAKTHPLKTVEKSINSGQNKNFFKILKKVLQKSYVFLRTDNWENMFVFAIIWGINSYYW